MTIRNPRLAPRMASGAVTLTVAGALALAAGPARADGEHVSCTTIELAMSKGKETALPKALEPLAKKLAKPPYTSWNVFKVLSSADFTLEDEKTKPLKLAAGSSTLILHDVEARTGHHTRLKVGIVFNGQNGKRMFDSTVSLDVGDYVDYGEIVAPNNDGHFVFLTCKL